MVFTKFVEVGRVVYVNHGPLSGKLCTIVAIVDGSRLLVDGPRTITGVRRQVINVKRITLTDIVVKIQVHAKEKEIKEAWKEANVLEEFAKSSFGKELKKQEIKLNMNDFDRFKLRAALRVQKAAIQKKMEELK